MDFFKSVFSEDPDPSDPQEQSLDPKKESTSPSQSPNTQNQEESTFHDINTNPNPKSPSDSSSSSTADGGSAWNFGGLIKTLASKSETVIQTYRRDLEEFGTGLKKETEIIREVASRAVKEIPASIEVGASVAQESLGSVWRGTSEIIANSKESFLESSASENESSEFRNSKPYSRFEMQVHSIQSDLNTYCEEPDDMEDFKKWKLGFVLEENGNEIESLSGENGAMEEVYIKLVPHMVDRETFWERYFYRVYKLRQAEDARANLVKRAISGEEEELSWDVDDDESSGYESKTTSPGTNEEKKEKEISEPVLEKKHIEEKVDDKTPVQESISNVSDNVDNEKVQLEDKAKPDEKGLPVGKNDDGESSSKGSEVPVVASQQSAPEEDIEWDEIEDLGNGSHEDKKVGVGGSPKRAELQKRLSVAHDDEEDLSWDIEEDDEPVKH